MEAGTPSRVEARRPSDRVPRTTRLRGHLGSAGAAFCSCLDWRSSRPTTTPSPGRGLYPPDFVSGWNCTDGGRALRITFPAVVPPETSTWTEQGQPTMVGLRGSWCTGSCRFLAELSHQTATDLFTLSDSLSADVVSPTAPPVQTILLPSFATWGRRWFFLRSAGDHCVHSQRWKRCFSRGTLLVSRPTH